MKAKPILIGAAALYASLGLYGTLRGLDLDAIRAFFVCVLYANGFYHAMDYGIDSLRGKK